MKCKIPWTSQAIKVHPKINNLNNPISITEIEFENKNLPTSKTLAQMSVSMSLPVTKGEINSI
jgi:hypothetical protein